MNQPFPRSRDCRVNATGQTGKRIHSSTGLLHWAVGALACLWLSHAAQAEHLPLDDFHPRVSARMWAMALQPDGKLLVGGDFVEVGGQTRIQVARLNPDGTLDPSFDACVRGDLTTLWLQADGKLLVGGINGGKTRAQ